MGDEADDILKSFTFAEGEGMTYETVKGKFDAHFIPKRNIIYERGMFNSRRQEDGETVDSFIAALYRPFAVGGNFRFISACCRPCWCTTNVQ